MKNKILFLIMACAMALAITVHAEESGSGHYIPGTFADFSGVPPSEPGIYAGNYFLNYGNGKFGGNKEMPFGGNFAVGVTANLQGEVPFMVYAYPWQIANITFSTGV